MSLVAVLPTQLPRPAQPDLGGALLAAYSDWTKTRWIETRLEADHTHTLNLMVMALVLPGECGEVAELVEHWDATGVRPEDDLVKELGDVIFYWARLCNEFNVRFAQPVLRPHTQEYFQRIGEHPFGLSLRPIAPDEIRAPVAEILRLTVWVGRIAEVFKKYVRDGEFNHVKFEEAMLGLLYAWMSVCRTAGLDWQHVVRVNQEKIEGRVARNTMRGSGNDR